MRRFPAVALLTVTLLLGAVGCTKQVSGTAQPDPNKAPLELSEDGFGIVAGFDNAPVKIEIFTEPQCTHCADLQADFGDQIAYNIGVGALKVTYRPLTFLDEDADGHSARVSNALFLAAEEGDGQTASRSCGPIRNPAAPVPVTTKWPTWPRMPACRMVSHPRSPMASLRSTSPIWTTPTSSTCSRSIR
jgi:hypothetical protein